MVKGFEMVSKAQQTKSAAMRERLVKVGRELFGTQGYSATSQAEICSAAGVSRGALNYHFQGKEELFKAVVCDVLQEFDASVKTNDLERDLRRYFAKALEPAIFKITIEDAPAVLGLEEWRTIETHYFVEPLLTNGISMVAARMAYGALLEATIVARSATDSEEVIAEAISIFEQALRRLAVH